MNSDMRIWVDADACPRVIKEVLYTVATRRKLSLVLVANSYLNIPVHPLISSVKVEQGADVADSYIYNNMSDIDIVVTADIPLAAEVVQRNGVALNPRGELYTEENISERLSVRDFMQELRDGGVQTDGPAAFGPKDREKFTNSLDRILTQKLK